MSWAAPEVSIPQIPEPAEHGEARVYFYDVPDAKQSVLSFGRIAVDATDENFYPLNVMNYRLGGGGFASLLTQQLREGKGYTYGIRSRFSGDQYSGNFRISSGVRSNVTFESSQLVKEILDDYAQGLTEEDLEVTKSFMLKSSARSFETAQAKLAMIRNISLYGYDPNYPALRMDYVRGLTMEELSDLASSNIDPDQLIYLVVGDAATQMDRMKELGYGEAILLNGEVTEIKD
jgi:zinc protease